MYPRAAAAATAALVGAGTLLMPASQAPAASAGVAPLVIAHRGASGEAPENTLAAVDRAHELGTTWVENDVQRTKDGVLVVIHDTDLKRTTDAEQVFPGRAPWRVGDFTAAELARLDAGSWKGPQYTGVRIPTLTQFVRRLEENGQNLLLEIKEPKLYPGIEEDILEVLGREHWLDEAHVRSRLVVQSFGADSVRTVHDLRPDITTGFLGNPPVADLPAYAAFADMVNPDFTTVTADYVRAIHALHGAHGARLETYVWEVNAPADVRRMAGHGVDGIITDYPDRTAAALGRHAPAASSPACTS